MFIKIGSITYIDPQILLLKACSQSLVTTLRECVDILQRIFAADCGFQSTSIVLDQKPPQGTPTFVSHIKKK